MSVGWKEEISGKQPVFLYFYPAIYLYNTVMGQLIPLVLLVLFAGVHGGDLWVYDSYGF